MEPNHTTTAASLEDEGIVGSSSAVPTASSEPLTVQLFTVGYQQLAKFPEGRSLDAAIQLQGKRMHEVSEKLFFTL